jgi:ABC-type branched-subunit amino acid transport system substrate-binding protein
LGLVVASAVILAACSSTSGSSGTTAPASGPSSGGTIPAAAFSDHTGVTAGSVTVGNVSILSYGLFKGAPVGTQAYADYVNSTGGVDGRKIVVDSTNDGFQGAPNQQQTQAAVQKDFAMVGSFSLEDSYGATVLAADPTVSNVSVALSQKASDLPNTFSVNPVRFGWGLGGLAYFKDLYPDAITHTGAIVSSEPAAQQTWTAEQQAMESLGYKIVADPTYTVTQSDFTQDVISMKNAGVKILYMEQLPQNYAGAVVQALNQQDFHPVVVLGAAGYSEAFVPSSGGATNADGVWLDQSTALYLGEDTSVLPADQTFLHWVQVASPGFKPDLYTLYGWLSAELFVQALKNAGGDPSRGSLMQQLRKITTFTGGGLIAEVNPVAKTPSGCYLIARIVNGTFQRTQDPPTSGSTDGFRCDRPFFYAK